MVMEYLEYGLQTGAAVCFQDLNREVLETVTAPTMLVNMDVLPPPHFILSPRSSIFLW